MAVKRILQENAETDSTTGLMLGLLAKDMPYVFVRVNSADVETGTLELSLDHNAPEGHDGAIALILEQALLTLRGE